MTRIVYVNGSYANYDSAVVHVEDRGFQFADAVYEVCQVKDRQLIDTRLHMDRLHRSLGEIRIRPPMSRAALNMVLRETARRNRVKNGLVYIQVSRGVAPRDFAFPRNDVAPSVICYARSVNMAAKTKRLARGLRVVTMPDIRWKRPDIKSVSLLPNVLARQKAYDAGADEAWLTDENGFVTEGAACNAWIITQDGTLVTRSAETGILRGITRTVLVKLLLRDELTFEERPFSVAEALEAREAFNSAATGPILPVVNIDGVAIGNGMPGPITQRLREHFYQLAEPSTRENLLT